MSADLAYMIVIDDGGSGQYIIAEMPEIPKLVYKTYLEAKRALLDVVAKFDGFIPVAYGSAYPYEHTTFEKEITNNEFALVGWIVIPGEEEDDAPSRVPVGLMKLSYSA
jgi:hypothetical protein